MKMPTCPYKGLIPYSEEDSQFFFGREKETAIIIANLRASKLTLVYGSTGAGKSSILSAGVAYQIRQMTRENLSKKGKAVFLVIIFKSWREEPAFSLKKRIVESLSQTLGSTNLQLDLESCSLSDILKYCSEVVGGDILIILDQFEQYFLWHPREQVIDKFVREFSDAVNDADLSANFLIAVREEWFTHLDRFKGPIPNLYDNYLRIKYLDREAARIAIEKPLERYNAVQKDGAGHIKIESTLVETILDELEHLEDRQSVLGEGRPRFLQNEKTDSLIEGNIKPACLQMVLVRLWNEEFDAKSNVLQLQTLQKLGGVQEIIKMHLDPVMKNFSLEECDICSEMFRYLVTPSGTKIAHKISDLASYAGIEKGKMAPVVLKLGSKSILREIPPPLGLNENRYEIYHDILGRAILDWQARFKTYKEWLSKRPWGYGRVLSSGNILELKGSTVSFGRWWPNGLTEFDRNKYLSRMHMFITFVKEENAFYAVDLRSKNGTTINAKCLCYGEEKKLQEGDIIVLAGTTPFQLWCINYLQKERFKVEKEFPFNQKDKGHIKEPHGWAVLVNGTTRIYDYIESDLCYLSKLPTGDIRISEKMQFEPFLILRRISKELAEFEFCDKKHALKFSSKTENKDFPIEFTMKYGESKFLNGTFAFKYRNVHFQIVPL